MNADKRTRAQTWTQENGHDGDANACHRKMPTTWIDGEGRGGGDGSGDQRNLVVGWPERGEISTGYADIADGDLYHGGGRGMSLKFGFREGKPFGLMVSSV